MTDCEMCLRAELPRWRWLACRALDHLDRPSPAAAMISAYGRSMSLMLGGRERTWYERHRDEWVRTGDRAELERMLRHVQDV